MEEGGGIKRAMGWRRKAVTNYCRLRGGKGIGRWWNDKIGRVECAECPKCGEKEQTPDHIVFLYRKVRRVKDESKDSGHDNAAGTKTTGAEITIGTKGLPRKFV